MHTASPVSGAVQSRRESKPPYSPTKIQTVVWQRHDKIASHDGIFDCGLLRPRRAVCCDRLLRRRRKPQNPAGAFDSHLTSIPVDSVFHGELSEGRRLSSCASGLAHPLATARRAADSCFKHRRRLLSRPAYHRATTLWHTENNRIARRHAVRPSSMNRRPTRLRRCRAGSWRNCKNLSARAIPKLVEHDMRVALRSDWTIDADARADDAATLMAGGTPARRHACTGKQHRYAFR